MGIEDWDGCEDWGWALGMGLGDEGGIGRLGICIGDGDSDGH